MSDQTETADPVTAQSESPGVRAEEAYPTEAPSTSLPASTSASPVEYGSDGPAEGGEALSPQMLLDPPEILTEAYLHRGAEVAGGGLLGSRLSARTARMAARTAAAGDEADAGSLSERTSRRSKASAPKSEAQLRRERKAKLIVKGVAIFLHLVILALIIAFAWTKL